MSEITFKPLRLTPPHLEFNHLVSNYPLRSVILQTFFSTTLIRVILVESINSE